MFQINGTHAHSKAAIFVCCFFIKPETFKRSGILFAMLPPLCLVLVIWWEALQYSDQSSIIRLPALEWQIWLPQ